MDNRRALDLAPNNPVVLVSAASLLASLGRPEEALELDQRALENDPMDLTIVPREGRTRGLTAGTEARPLQTPAGAETSRYTL